MSADAANQPFSRRALILLLAAGILGFVAFLILSAYAPDMRSGRDGGTHAMSTAATGFRGLYRLNELTRGGKSMLIRDKKEIETGDLFVLAPQHSGQAKAMIDLARERQNSGDAGPTLIILPKWATMPDPKRRDWVISFGPTDKGDVGAVLKDLVGTVTIAQPLHKPGTTVQLDGYPAIRFTLPKQGQTIAGTGIEPVLEDPEGGAILARIVDEEGEGNLYVLADPDLANNMGLKDKANARAMLELLWALNPDDPGTIAFDVTVAGYARAPNLLKLAFEPPFLPVTLCLFVAALLAGLHALVRFGPALGEARLIAFGKSALLDNSADLLRRAGHEHRGGDRYVALTREAVAHAVGVPSDMPVDRIDRYLDRLTTSSGRRWSELAARVAEARTRNDLVRAARALHDWRKEVTRGNR